MAEADLVNASQWSRTLTLHHLTISNPTPNPLSHHRRVRKRGEILFIMPNRYCRRNARCLVQSSPHRKFQKCSTRVLILSDETQHSDTDQLQETNQNLATYFNGENSQKIVYNGLSIGAVENRPVRHYLQA